MATRSTNQARTRKGVPGAETAAPKRGAGTPAKPSKARPAVAVIAGRLSTSLEQARANLRDGDVFLDHARKILG